MILQKLKEIFIGMDQKLNKKVFDKGYISGHLIQAITGKDTISFN